MARPPKPRVDSSGQKQLQEAQEKFDRFDQQVKEMTMDRMNEAPQEEFEPQTKLSPEELKKLGDVYLKPVRTQFSGPVPKGPNQGKMQDVFNEKFRKAYEYDREYVRFIAENHEIIGEEIDLWTKPYPGVPAEEWKVPTNKPVWGPRYLAEQIKRKKYHRLVMQETSITGSDGMGTYTGSIVADTTKQRLDARPAPRGHFAFNKKVSNF